MVRLKTKYFISLIIILFIACKHKPADITINSGYPKEVGSIILGKCAVAGCHNNTSYKGAGSLNLTTWNKMFEGGSIGACVIPFRSDFSTLCYYTNIDTNLGVTLLPTMPVNATPLNTQEYLTLKDWIEKGAPNNKGIVKFTGNPKRKKIYITNQLCDVVTVFDANSLLQMRYIDVGHLPTEEFPYGINVSPDKQNWYVSFFTPKQVVQKYSAEDDQFLNDIYIGSGNWLNFTITQDSRYGFFADHNKNGKIAYVDLQNSKLLATYKGINYPTNIALNEAFNKMYVGCLQGNYVYDIDITEPLKPEIKELPIDGTNNIIKGNSLNPVDLKVINEKCYIACSQSKDIRVVDILTGKLETIIPIKTNPSRISISKKRKLLFVSCPDDTKTFPGNRGSIIVIDTKTNTEIKRIDSGYQPFGIAVDDEQDIVTVVNANISPEGDEPHHSSDCEGRNGNVTFIDMSTLELVYKSGSEVAVYPFGVATR